MAAAFSAFFAGAPPVRGQDFTDQAVQFGQNVQQEVVRRLAASGRNDLVKLARDVRLEIDRTSPIPNAYARRDSGQSKIVVTAELIKLYYYMAELATLNLEQQGRWGECHTAYSSYVRTAFNDIATKVQQGRPAQPLLAPDQFQSARCNGLGAQYPLQITTRLMRDRSVSSALAFVTLHEFGHHYRLHSNLSASNLDITKPADMRRYLEIMCTTRGQEKEADEFAAKTLVDLGTWQVATDQTFAFALTATGRIEPYIEFGGTHPSAPRRLSNIMATVRTELAAANTPMPRNLSDLVDQLILLQEKIDRTLPVAPMPGTEGFRCNN